MRINKNPLMDDNETLNRRARLRELIRECFNGQQADLLRYIEQKTGEKPNQGELSAILKDHSGKSFGDIKGKNLAAQIGLNRRWFDMPPGSNLHRATWMGDLLLSSNTVNQVVRAEYALDNNIEVGPETRGVVPLISWVRAGYWSEVVDNFAPGDGEEMIETSVQVKRHTYALRVSGDSMTNPSGYPSFPEGMIIICEPEFDHQHGDFVIVKNGDNEATFKQLIRDGADWLLKPLNPRYPIKPLPADAAICGVVREFRGRLR